MLVMLGIAPCDHPLATQRVFQTADGTTRMCVQARVGGDGGCCSACVPAGFTPPRPLVTPMSHPLVTSYTMPFTVAGSGCGQDATMGAADNATDDADLDGPATSTTASSAAVTTASPHPSDEPSASPATLAEATTAADGATATAGATSSSGSARDDTVGGDTTMWQLSFPMDEEAARALGRDPEALKAEALRRCGGWHEPIPQLLHATPPALVCGYPVYVARVCLPGSCECM